MFRVIVICADKVIEEKILNKGDSIIIGRSGEYADVIIPDDHISKKHCRIFVRGGSLYIEDLGSTNHTFVNNVQLGVCNPVTINPVDEIQLTRSGRSRIKVKKEIDRSEIGSREISFDKDLLTIGRAEDNDIVIPLPAVSRYHARIIRQDNRLFIEDLNSTNGTFVNGVKITERVEVAPGARISLGSYILSIKSPEKLTGSSLGVSLELKGIKLAYAVKGRYIIKDANFVAKNGELVGVIGPAGGGKTTFMNILAGLYPDSEGRVLLNGEDLYENYESFCTSIGYAPQDDIIHSELTVFQSLYYTARLRLPEDTTEEERLLRVEQVLKELGIEHIKNSIIGSVEKKIISGGERKRVNIGQELISEPCVLFLDEPVTGLDPGWRRDVVKHLRKLADSGKIVIAITHDVQDEESASYFDKIVVIADGKQVFFGPGKDLFRFFGKKYIADIFEELEKDSEKVEYWHKKFLASHHYKKLREKITGIPLKKSYQNPAVMHKRTSMMSQFSALVSRYIKRKISDRMQPLFLLLQAPIIGLILALLYDKLKTDVLLFMGMSAIWFGLMNSMREIVSEKAIYRREKMVSVKDLAYTFSKIYVLGLLGLFQSIALLVVAGTGILDIWRNFPLLFIVLFLSTLVSITMGLAISALIPRESSLVAIIPIIMVIELIFGGIIKRLSELGPLEHLANVIPSRWTMESLINVVPGLPSPDPRFCSAREYFGFGGSLILDIIILVVLSLFFFILTNLFLQLKEK